MRSSLRRRATLGSAFAALGVGLTALSAHPAAAQTLVFDNLSNFENSVKGATGTTTGSTPNTFMGDGYTLLSGTKDITGFDVAPVNLSGTDYIGLQGTIYVWGTVNTGTVSATAPAFSNLLGTYTFTSTGTFTNGFYFPFQGNSVGTTPGIALTTPLAISSNTIGLTLSYQGTTDGVNYATANGLTSLVTTGTPPTVGSQVFNGYYRNANSETNGNFTSSLRSLGLTNQSLGVRVFGDVAAPVPEASTTVSFGLLLALGMGSLIVASKRKKAGAQA